MHWLYTKILVSHLLALRVDDVHLVGGVLLPAHRRPERGRIFLVPAGLPLPKTLLDVDCLVGKVRIFIEQGLVYMYLLILLIVDDKNKRSVKVAGFFWANS